MAMKTNARISIFLLLIVGCVGDVDRRSALTTWNSPNSNPQERTEAVNKLIPSGTDKAEVERILGKKGTLVHFHSINTSHAEDSLEYPVPGGAISLLLRPASQGRLSFVKAVFTPLQRNSREQSEERVQKEPKP